MYNPRTFTIPTLKGISENTLDEHMKLYQGYVKHTNYILNKVDELSADTEKNAYELAELHRRLGFEFGGMRNHECYFALLEKGASELSENSPLYKKITEQWGSFEIWMVRFKALAATRGVGWAMLSYDPQGDTLINSWVDEQHQGQLAGLSPVVALDMWEHSFVADYAPSGKKKYINDFFENINWNVANETYAHLLS